MSELTINFVNAFGAKSLYRRIRNALVKRKLYNLTVSELEKLSNRELADMGIHRCEIKRVAKEHADRVETNENLKGWV